MKLIKTLFDTPRHALLTVICTVALVALLATSTAFAVDTIAENNAVGKQAAQRFAANDAGVKAVSTQAGEVAFAYEDGQYVYEVAFTADDTQYEYTLRASDGEVLSKQETPIEPVTEPITATTYLTTEQIKLLALSHAGLTAAEVTFEEVKLETDDRIAHYDVDFFTESAEYDYEIDAVTGAILEWDMEAHTPPQPTIPQPTTPQPTAPVPTVPQPTTPQPTTPEPTVPQPTTPPPTTPEPTVISAEQAKQIALTHAQLSAASVTITKTKLEREDGLLVYEIEFYCGNMEYEYTIDAYTGAILEFESEYDD